jgi:hypothetical protein
MNEIQKAQKKWEAQECRLMGWPTPEEIAQRAALERSKWSEKDRQSRLVQKPQALEVLEWVVPSSSFRPGII